MSSFDVNATPLPGVPSDDIYSVISLDAAPSWPADGLSCHASGMFGAAGEQMSPAALGYAGVVGSAGLGWEANPLTLTAAPAPFNCSWRIATRLIDDVVQPFAANAGAFLGTGGTGSDPNFGYAGIWPDMFRATGPDAIGIRLRATAPTGTPAIIAVATGAFFALSSVPGVVGSLGLDLSTVFLITPSTLTVAAPLTQPSTTSEAAFGPFAGDPAFAGLTVYVQGVTFQPPGPVLTTMCRISL